MADRFSAGNLYRVRLSLLYEQFSNNTFSTINLFISNEDDDDGGGDDEMTRDIYKYTKKNYLIIIYTCTIAQLHTRTYTIHVV